MIGKCAWIGVAAGRISLPNLDHRVGNGIAGTIHHPADDADALARSVISRYAAVSNFAEAVAILACGKSQSEERADRLRRGLRQEIGSSGHDSNGVSSRPRSTIS